MSCFKPGYELLRDPESGIYDGEYDEPKFPKEVPQATVSKVTTTSIFTFYFLVGALVMNLLTAMDEKDAEKICEVSESQSVFHNSIFNNCFDIVVFGLPSTAAMLTCSGLYAFRVISNGHGERKTPTHFGKIWWKVEFGLLVMVFLSPDLSVVIRWFNKNEASCLMVLYMLLRMTAWLVAAGISWKSGKSNHRVPFFVRLFCVLYASGLWIMLIGVVKHSVRHKAWMDITFYTALAGSTSVAAKHVLCALYFMFKHRNRSPSLLPVSAILRLFFACCCAAVWGASYISVVYFQSQLVASWSLGEIWIITVSLVFLAVGKVFSVLFLKLFDIHLEPVLEERVYQHLLKSDTKFSAEKIKDDVEHKISEFIKGVIQFSKIWFPGTKLLVSLCILLFVDFRLTAFIVDVISMSAVFILNRVFVWRPIQKNNIDAHSASLHAKTQEILTKLNSIKLLKISELQMSELRACQEERQKYRMTVLFSGLAGTLGEWICLGLITVLGQFFAYHLKQRGIIDQDQAAAYLFLSEELIVGLYEFIRILKKSGDGVRHAKFLCEILEHCFDTKLNGEDRYRKRLSFEKDQTDDYTIVIENLDMMYSEKQENGNKKKVIFQKFNLTIPQNSSCGIVGESGVGKSTLADILTRSKPYNGGCIKIGPQNLTNIPIDQLYDLVYLVEQSPVIFSGTVLHNLMLACPDEKSPATQQLLQDLKVQVLADIDFDMEACKLSKGQMQRVSACRALFSNARILILDEATSALDIQNELALMDFFYKIKNKTILCIAHRLHIVEPMDKILVLKGNHQWEDGTHMELCHQQESWYHTQRKKLISNRPWLVEEIHEVYSKPTKK